MIILIILIILILIQCSNYNSSSKFSSLSDICIILTCTVNVGKNIRVLAQKDSNERKQLYLNSINSWINYTPFNIIVVDNSGYTFPELTPTDKLQIVSYTEEALPEPARSILASDPSKGIHEIYAINYAYRNSKFTNCDFIIKVTGRYYIPNLETYLKEPLPDFIRQNNNSRCELVGCKKEYFNYLFNVSLEYNGNEHNRDFIEIIYKRRIDNMDKIKKVLNLQPLKIPATRTGSGGVINQYL